MARPDNIETLEQVLTACCNSCGSEADFRASVERAILRSEHSLRIAPSEHIELCGLLKNYERTLNGLTADHPRTMKYFKMDAILRRGPHRISRQDANWLRRVLGD